ncbi:type II toxin-antitoxin system RelE/ParE family toxin [Luteolibacter soli]|uniref:type II toxin-antitoxin system RelE/ParE family toxin n=1 Tax=Luteolibacter soli TaxID=3135280 RepID=UPI0035C8A067
MEIRYLREAQEDIREALEYLSDRSPSAAERFSRDLIELLEKVATHPGFGYPFGPFFRKVAMRSLPWAVVYRTDMEAGILWVVVVRHDRRHPSYGMKRSPPDP